MPRLESLAVVKGEYVCTNEDIIRNAAYSWSRMTADDIEDKTGIRERRYTERRLEHISLQAAHAALGGAGRRPEEIGAVIFCSCTTTTLIPSVATWLSGQLGIFQTHGSFLGRGEGATKLLIDPETRRILGAGMVGVNAGELIAETVHALEMGADAEDLGLTIHPHPTLSETVGFAAEAAEGTITDLYMPKRPSRAAATAT